MPPKTNASKISAVTNDNGDEASPIDVEALETAAGPNGIAAYELPRSKGMREQMLAVLPILILLTMCNWVVQSSR
jgi:hypothetical protein